MAAIFLFRNIKNKHDVYEGKYCINKFCEFIREDEIKIIIFKKKKLELITKEEQESYEKAKYFNICKENFENKYLKDKKYRKVTDQCHYTEEVLRIAYVI